MSSAPKTSDPSILRKFELSKKEEDLSKKLFQKKGRNSHASPGRSSVTSKTTKRSEPETKEATKTSTKSILPSIPDQVVDNFLRSMESEFKQLNKNNNVIDQVTVGMLTTQNEILKKQTEILNENQRNIAAMIKENFNPNSNVSALNKGAQKEIIKELVSPINTQIEEIKKIYDETRRMAEDVAKNVGEYKILNEKPQKKPELTAEAQKSMKKSMDEYHNLNSNLKDMVLNAQGNLSHMLPENMHILNEISNLNIQAYTECINTLKKQIQDLQKDAEKAEKELEMRYKKIAEIPKQTTLKKTDPYYSIAESNPGPAEEIIKHIRTIDYTSSRTNILNKLGGEFDYDNFSIEVEDIIGQISDVQSQFREDMSQYRIYVPPSLVSEEDKALILADVKLPSILDEIKSRFNIPKRPPKNFKPLSPKEPIYFGFPDESVVESTDRPGMPAALKGKKKNAKPESLIGFRTQPEHALPDVEFVRYDKQVPKFEPIVTKPPVEEAAKPQQESEKVSIQAQKKREKTPEKLFQPVETKLPVEKSPAFKTPAVQEEEKAQVYLNMEKYDMKRGDEIRPRESQLNEESIHKAQNASDWFGNNMIENLILQDIKDHLAGPVKSAYRSDKPMDSRPTATTMATRDQSASNLIPSTSNRDGSRVNLMAHLGINQPSLLSSGGFTNQQVDENTLKQLTIQALSERMPELVTETRRSKIDEIFKPVSTQIPQSNKPQETGNVGGIGNAVDPAQLSNALAENIMGLFNNAMLQINTSLSKTLPSVAQVPLLAQPLGQIRPLGATGTSFAPREESEQQKTGSDFARKSGPFMKPNLVISTKTEEDEKQEERPTVLDGLSKEEREIMLEQSLLRQHKPFIPSNKVPTPGIPEDYPPQGFYFMNNEPKPLANLSEYMRELNSELSSSGSLESHRKNEFMRRHHPLESSALSKSEGQVNLPHLDYNTMMSDEEGPKFGRKGKPYIHDVSEGSGTDTPMSNMGYSGGKLFGKPITDNLIKNLHEEAGEPGEVNINNLFKV